MNKGKWVIAAAAALALGVLTLPLFMTGGSGSPVTEAASAKGASCQAEGPANLNLTLKDMNDAEFKLSSLKGKVVLVNFWASWCAPCLAEIPEFIKVREAYSDKGFEILGISLDRDTGHDKLVSTIKDRGMSWRHVYDGKFWSAEVAQIYDVQSIPFTVLIGKDGKVIGTSLRGDKLGPAVEAALEAK